MNKLMLIYLQISTAQVTATNFSRLLDSALSPDQLTLFLSEKDFKASDLWDLVKPEVRSLEESISKDEYGVLIIDDFVVEKRYSSENDLISYHYDHSQRRSVKGINQLSVIDDISDNHIPVAFDFVYKTEQYFHKKKQKICRRSPENQHEKFRKLVLRAYRNDINFKYVLADSWYCSKANMRFVKEDCKGDFIFACAKNRKLALSKEAKAKGDYQGLESLSWQEGVAVKVWVKGVGFPLLAIRQVFKNGDGSTGMNFLLCSDLNLDYQQITTIYKRRWKVEEHHRVLQSNLGYAKAPVHTPRTLANHCFVCLYAFFDQQK